MTLNSATLLHSSQASNRHYAQPLPKHTSQFPTPTPTTLPPSVSYSANFIKAVNARVLDLLHRLLETAFQSEITRMQLEKRLRCCLSTLGTSRNNSSFHAKCILVRYLNKNPGWHVVSQVFDPSPPLGPLSLHRYNHEHCPGALAPVLL